MACLCADCAGEAEGGAVSAGDMGQFTVVVLVRLKGGYSFELETQLGKLKKGIPAVGAAIDQAHGVMPWCKVCWSILGVCFRRRKAAITPIQAKIEYAQENVPAFFLPE